MFPVLGPLLKNIMYDVMLRIRVPKQVTLIGFPDHLMVTNVELYSNENFHAIKNDYEWLN